MNEILVNQKIFGKFSLSFAAVSWLAENNHPIAKSELSDYETFGKKKWYGNGHTLKFDGYKRDDQLVVECFKKLETLANGTNSELKIVRVPKGIDWCLQSNYGYEWIAERHKTWE